MSEDYHRSNCNSKMAEQMVLRDISFMLKIWVETLQTIDFPELDASGKLINIKIFKNFFINN
jgi:hypothetical protein